MSTVDITLAGVPPFTLALHDQRDLHVSGYLRRHKVWESHNTAFLRDTIRPGDRVVDVGAHLGYFTVMMSRLVGERGHVFAFEPEAANFALLERNLELNRVGNVTAERKALSDRVGKAMLYLSPENAGDHRLYRSPDERAMQEVDTVTLDGYLDGRDEAIRLVKIDAQGLEPKIVDGMSMLIGRNRQWLTLLMEFTPGMIESAGCDLADFLRRLESLGASVFWFGEGRGRPWLTRATVRDLRGIADMMLRTRNGDYPAEVILRFDN